MIARVLLAQKAFSDVSVSIAFAVFDTVENAERAQQGANGMEFEGKHLRVTMMTEKQMDNDVSVFVGNLPFGTMLFIVQVW